jgi:CRP/FNR family transcriptional regulator, cyclic AMP receptor protein
MSRLPPPLPAGLPAGLLARGLLDMGPCNTLASQATILRQSAGLLEDFSNDELSALGAKMCLAQAQAGQVLMAEGEIGDWMLLVLSGTVDVSKRIMRHDASGAPSQELLEVARLAVVRAGASLGEMSLFDSEPRYATCTAIEAVSAGILTRAVMGQLIREHPAVGAKLMVKITQLLAQRLRSTSAKLVQAVAQRKQGELFKA